MANEKILIVDDEANSRTLLKLELEKAGYQVFEAEDGDAGYQIAKGIKPDLVISDILMPQMDGNQLMKKLRESEFCKNVPFIVLSARTQMQGYFEMMNADEFIPKPFNSGELLEKVDQVLIKSGKKKKAAQASVNDKNKVLILDNERKDYEAFKKVLMDNKFEVEVIQTVEGCIKCVKEYEPDLIAIRFIIDRMNGDRIVQSLKEKPEFKDIPCLVYSLKVRGWEEEKVRAAGAVGFIGEISEVKILDAVVKLLR